MWKSLNNQHKVEGLDVAQISKDDSEKSKQEVQKVDIKQLLALGNVAHGEKVFKNVVPAI